MAKPKKYKNPVRLSVIVEAEFKKHIERQARYMGQQESRNVSFNEACQRALEIAYPLEKQMNLKY